MEGAVQWVWMPSFSAARPDKGGGAPVFFFLGVQSSICWQIGWGANQSGLQRDKDHGEGSWEGGAAVVRIMTCQMRKKTYWKGQSGREKKHIEPMEKYNLLTIWFGGWQQPSSVFWEPDNKPNYSVRKIKESQRAVEWKKKVLPIGVGKVYYCCRYFPHFILSINIVNSLDYVMKR